MVLHRICVAQHLAALLHNWDIFNYKMPDDRDCCLLEILDDYDDNVFYVYRISAVFIQDPMQQEVFP